MRVIQTFLASGHKAAEVYRKKTPHPSKLQALNHYKSLWSTIRREALENVVKVTLADTVVWLERVER
jgi:hypothetical protein